MQPRIPAGAKKIAAFFALAAVLALLYFLGSAIFGGVSQVTALTSLFSDRRGSIRPQVVDGWTDRPLEGAYVVIPEINKKFVTDKNGYIETVTVPIVSDSEYKNILTKPWGEITLLIYKEGYIPYALFHTQVWENETRNGPIIMLFAEGSTASGQPFTIIEGPPRLWVNELLLKYAPEELLGQAATPSPGTTASAKPGPSPSIKPSP